VHRQIAHLAAVSVPRAARAIPRTWLSSRYLVETALEREVILLWRIRLQKAGEERRDTEKTEEARHVGNSSQNDR